jgi:hypothetical protein
MTMLRTWVLATLLATSPAGAAPEADTYTGVSTPVLTLWITGGVGLAVGVSFGIKALVHQSRATDVDYVGGQHQIAATRTSQLVANIGYSVGLASLAAGLIMQRLFPERAVTLVPTPSSVGLRVQF